MVGQSLAQKRKPYTLKQDTAYGHNKTIFSADEEVGLFHIFAEGDMATSIVDLAPDIEVEVSARGAYAVYIDPDYWPRDPYHKVFDDRFGFVVEQILSVGPRSTQA